MGVEGAIAVWFEEIGDLVCGWCGAIAVWFEEIGDRGLWVVRGRSLYSWSNLKKVSLSISIS